MNPAELLHFSEKDCERRLLSSMIADGKIYPEIKEHHFTGEENRFFAALYQQWNDFGDIDTAILHEKYPTKFKELLDHTAFFGKETFEKLQNAHLWRVLGQSILSNNDKKPVDAINKLLEKLGGAVISKTGSYNHGREIKLLMDVIDKGCVKSENEVQGYSTGIYLLDNAMSGIEPGKAYAIGALKKTGKSRFMVYLACKLSEQGAGCLINSLEMRPIELNSLVVSYYSGVNSARIGRKLYKDEMRNITEAYGKLNNMNWTINRDYYLTELKSRILYERQKRKIDVVFIDFIQRMRCDEYKGDRVRSVEHIAMGLADIAKELNVAIIELCQLKGEAEHLKSDVVPDMSHLKESQGIGENADVIITMHDPERKKEKNPNEYNGTIFKMRIEQRYDISGSIVDVFGNMKNCRFRSKTEQDGNSI